MASYRRFESSGEMSLRSLVMLAFALDMTDEFEALFNSKTYQSVDDILRAGQSEGVLPMPSFFKKRIMKQFRLVLCCLLIMGSFTLVAVNAENMFSDLEAENQFTAYIDESLTQEEAKEMMDTQEVIILDVREQDEYDSGHIPGAVLLPVGMIDETTAAEVIPETDSTVLVYCRSGNRSKTASSTLAELGYTNIYEFGGINTWPYETET